MSDQGLIDYQLSAGVCTITMTDEARKNVLSSALVAELIQALDRADADPAARVVVLTNSGRVFCAGADLSERSGADQGGASSTESNSTAKPHELFARFQKSPKPYVGRIAGHCVAGGMGLAAAMDISVAVDTAKMGFTEVRVGVAPAMISVLCLPKMQAGAAREALLRGRRFLASEAERIGLINHAVPADELDATVDGIVEDLLAGGPNALAATKQLLDRVPQMTTDEAFAWTGPMSAELFRSAEAKEGMSAFLEKRSPSWLPTQPSPESGAV